MAGDSRESVPTPGPWEVVRAGFPEGTWLVNGYLYGALRGRRGMTAGDVGLQRLYRGQCEADARLIASAPNLLAENERLREALRRVCVEGLTVEMCFALASRALRAEAVYCRGGLLRRR